MALTYQEAWNAQPDGRSREEIFQSIVADIKAHSKKPMSDAEAQEAAHNLIAFVCELGGLDSKGNPIDPK